MTHTIEDLMASAIGQRPVDFENSFNALMMQKAGEAVEARKAEMAKYMFNGDPRPEIEEETDEETVEVEEEAEIEERFGGKGSEVGIRNNPPQGKPGGAAPTPAAPKGTGKSDLMTSLSAVRKAKTPIMKTGS